MQATVQEGSAAHERMRQEEDELGAKHSAEMERINQKYGGSLRRYSVYLLSWYKITQFTCFPGTRVQILTLRSPLRSVNRERAPSGSEKLQFTCFNGKKSTKVTNTDAFALCAASSASVPLLEAKNSAKRARRWMRVWPRDLARMFYSRIHL